MAASRDNHQHLVAGAQKQQANKQNQHGIIINNNGGNIIAQRGMA